jgi:hypothetical protein
VFARRPIYSRNGHYVIDGLDGLGDMPISFGISVIANELIGQTKVDIYMPPHPLWIAAFESGGIKTLHCITGTRWVQQRSVAVLYRFGNVFLLIVS